MSFDLNFLTDEVCAQLGALAPAVSSEGQRAEAGNRHAAAFE